MKKLLLITFVLSVLGKFNLNSQNIKHKNYTTFLGAATSITFGKGTPNFNLDSKVTFSDEGPETFSLAKVKQSFGVQFNKNLMVGIQPQIILSNRKGVTRGEYSDPFSYSEKINQYGIGVFMRNMFNVYRKFSVGVETNINISKITHKTKINDKTDPSDLGFLQYAIGISPVVSYHITPRFRLIGFLGDITYAKRVYNFPLLAFGKENTIKPNFYFSNIYFGGEFLF